MELRYKHLLSPVRVRNTVLRNRLIATPSSPIYIQATEKYPTKAMIEYYTRKALAGPSLIVVGGGVAPNPHVNFTQGCPSCYDISRGREGWQHRNMWSQMVEAVHFAGAKIFMYLRPSDAEPVPPGFDVCEGNNLFYFPEGGRDVARPSKEIPREMMDARIEDMAANAAYWKLCGFDGVSINCSYRGYIEGRFLSKLTNRRTDEFGGCAENRARYVVMLCKKIRELCGKDFLIQLEMSGTDEREGGNEIADTIELIHILDEHIDIVETRSGDMDNHHTIGTCPEKTPFLAIAAQIKASKPRCLISCGGGFQDLDICEDAIATGKLDMISAARAWICDLDYGKKAYAGQGEEVVPCIRCNKCHGNVADGKLGVVMCSVNPTTATIFDKLDLLVQQPGAKQKVAVIGGGPAGMQAALTAANRGHEVTLFEKSDHLGGALIHAEYCKTKWPLLDYMRYQSEHTLRHENITVLLGVEATPELIAQKNFDRVIVAIGAQPLYPPIQGIHDHHVTYAEEAFGHHEKFGHKIVVIGGGEIGVDTGVYFAENGHEVMVLEMNPRLAMGAQPVHYRSLMQRHWESEPNFRYAVNAKVLKVEANKVTYTDGDGVIQTLQCDNVVLAAGKKDRIDDSLAFAGTAPYVEPVGDCVKAADIMEANRTAYAAATRF